jgi:hypothetical protein
MAGLSPSISIALDKYTNVVVACGEVFSGVKLVKLIKEKVVLFERIQEK